ncbi:MAG: hypothetical protein QF805_03975 [Pirellulaceae bacterium]|jgi:Na+/pantothenate symporter|nr:hypothetical protein [Pirellulaceae bacterium]
MNWLDEHAFHLLLIAVYLGVLVYHAVAANRNVESVNDYLTAGRRLGGVVIGLSFYATFMSTNTFIGAAGKSWDHGLAWCFGGLVLSGLALASWFIVAPKFVPLTRHYNSLTVADFLGSHYRSEAVRRVAALIVAFSSVLYLIAIYRGAALAVASFLDLPYAVCVLAVLLIVTAYTLAGGFESVVLTDSLQGALMLVGAGAIAMAMWRAGDGVEIFSAIRAQDPKLASASNWAAISASLAYGLAVGVKYLVEPRQLSRFYGLKDQRALRIASIVAPLAIIVTYGVLLPLGAMARAIIPPGAIESSDQVIPYLLGSAELLGPVVGALFLLVLVSAAMSSIDSVLLVAASTIDRDLCRATTTAVSTGATMRDVQWTRAWVVALSLTAALIALIPGVNDIVKLTKFSGSLYGACFVPVLVCGLYIRRSATTALATMITGTITVIGVFTLRQFGRTTMQEVYPGMAIGLILFLLLSQRSGGGDPTADDVSK